MKFELRHELNDGMIHVNIWGSLPIKAKSRFKGPCGNEHDVFQKQTEGLHGWTEINKGDTCMKVSSRRRQGSDYICLCKPQWGFYFYSTCNGKPSEEISSRVNIIWFIFFKKGGSGQCRECVWGVHIIRGLRICFKGSTGKTYSKAIVSSYLTLNKLLNLTSVFTSVKKGYNGNDLRELL